MRKQKYFPGIIHLFVYSGFRHVMTENLITSFLNPSIINGITIAPLIVFQPCLIQKHKIMS